MRWDGENPQRFKFIYLKLSWTFKHPTLLPNPSTSSHFPFALHGLACREIPSQNSCTRIINPLQIGQWNILPGYYSGTKVRFWKHFFVQPWLLFQNAWRGLARCRRHRAGTGPQLCRDISLHTGKDNPPSEGLRESELQEHSGIRTGSVLLLLGYWDHSLPPSPLPFGKFSSLFCFGFQYYFF